MQLRFFRMLTVVAVSLICLGLLACGAPSEAPSSDESSLLITNVRVVDPLNDSVSTPQDVWIVDGEFREAPSDSNLIADQTLDGSALYALPGLIDVHAHIGTGGLGRANRESSAHALEQYLRFGVTGIFAPGGGTSNEDYLAEWSERCGSGELNCPQIFGSGALLTAPGGHPISTIWKYGDDVTAEELYDRGATAITDDTPIEELVADKQAKGVHALKVVLEDWDPDDPIPSLTVGQLERITQTAHGLGMKVFAHVSQAAHVRMGLNAGIDGVMHSCEDPLPGELLEEMADSGMYYVATLSLYDGFRRRAHSQFDWVPFAVDGIQPAVLESLAGFSGSPFTPEHADRVWQVLEDNLRRAREYGVPLAMGTDTANPGVFPGYSAHRELELMVEAGLTPAQALTAATTGAADFLGQPLTMGRIAPGQAGDLLLLSENPLEDILHTRSIRYVIQGGKPVPNVASSSGL